MFQTQIQKPKPASGGDAPAAKTVTLQRPDIGAVVEKAKASDSELEKQRLREKYRCCGCGC